MATNKELLRFVRGALTAGKSRDEISDALTASGWSASEVRDALAAWADTPFSPPVPRPQAIVSARDFFFYTLTFGLLIYGAFHLISLLHSVIDYAMEERGYYLRGMRFSIASLIVVGPLYLWLAWRDQQRLAQDPAHYRSAIRKWVTYIALLLAASVLVGDLVAVIYALLDGDLTPQFFLKALVVAVVTGLLFIYYRRDLHKGDAL